MEDIDFLRRLNKKKDLKQLNLPKELIFFSKHSKTGNLEEGG